MELKLKPCPFCGGSAEISHTIHPPFEHYAYCKKCGCQTLPASDPQKAEGVWNKRQKPPNPPLTLEELREMDGEPVWIKDKYENIYADVLRNVARSEGRIYIRLMLHPDHQENGYGKTWYAYRRKPEEET